MTNGKLELLAPAGSLEKLKTAFAFGADAVYAGGKQFSLRNAAQNFTEGELREALDYTHSLGKKLYIAANIVARNADLAVAQGFFETAAPLSPDAFIVSDLGLFALAQRVAPEIPLHVSTQASCANIESARAWRDLGAKRVILARELSLSEIAEIREAVPGLELEAFVHGAMCMAYSGRCLLSNFLAGRDANRGDCAQPCRWKYRAFALEEELRPGEFLPIEEDGRGAYVFNAKDLCMVDHVPALVESGLTSLKIEGRVKSAYYVAAIVKAYRGAIDACFEGGENPSRGEVFKVSRRDYTTGFFFGKPDGDAHRYESGDYLNEYEVAGVVVGYEEATGLTALEQRNRFFSGDALEGMPPKENDFSFTAGEMYTSENEKISVAPRARMIVKMDFGRKLENRTFLRRLAPRQPSRESVRRHCEETPLGGDDEAIQ
jgi:putative protease